MIEVEYEATAACVEIEKALAQDAPLVHESEPDNVAGFMKQSTGNVEKAFAEADHVIKETLRVHRGGCHAIETRGIVAQFDPKGRISYDLGFVPGTAPNSPHAIAADGHARA